MPYISCRYAPPDPTGLMGEDLKQGENARITCIDDQGRTWWLTEDSQVGDWLEYKQKGGEVTPYVEIETQPAPEEEETPSE
jgi:hypothetical protein